MSASVFHVLNLSTGELITIYEYCRATIRSQSRISSTSEYLYRPNIAHSWYVAPPSHEDLVNVSRYLNVPYKALQCISAHSGYTYDAE